MEKDLALRTKRFALRVIKLYSALPKREEARVIGRQVLRSGTSIGANYREAQQARSHPEFISKIGTCLQEADETVYWLELLIESDLVPEPKLEESVQEARELTAIFAASCKTAKCRGK